MLSHTRLPPTVKSHREMHVYKHASKIRWSMAGTKNVFTLTNRSGRLRVNKTMSWVSFYFYLCQIPTCLSGRWRREKKTPKTLRFNSHLLKSAFCPGFLILKGQHGDSLCMLVYPCTAVCVNVSVCIMHVCEAERMSPMYVRKK